MFFKVAFILFLYKEFELLLPKEIQRCITATRRDYVNFRGMCPNLRNIRSSVDSHSSGNGWRAADKFSRPDSDLFTPRGFIFIQTGPYVIMVNGYYSKKIKGTEIVSHYNS